MSRADKWLTGTFCLLVLYIGIRAFVAASLRSLWYDEICTWVVVQQHGLSGMWNALMHAVDSHPLGFYAIEKIPGMFIGKQEVALRIPSILGVCAAFLCLFVWIKTSTNALLAWVCCLFLMLSPLRDYYAIEARAYGLLAGCLTLALVCYQRADRRPLVLLLGLTLALAEAFHFYAIFFVAAFAAAELVYLSARKKFRARVWMALFAPIAPLVASLPLLSLLKTTYNAHVWAQPNALETLNVYAWLIGADNIGLPPSVPGRMLVVFTFCLAVGLLIYRLAEEYQRKDPRAHESVLLLALLLTPWVMYFVLKSLHGGLTVRYMVPFAVCIPLVLSQFLKLVNRKTLIIIGVTMSLLLTGLEISYWKLYYPLAKEASNPAQVLQSFLKQAGHADLPVLISNPVDYLSLEYYASGDLSRRLCEPLDTPAEMQYSNDDTVERNLAFLAPYMAPHVELQLPRYKDFLAKYPTFVVYASTGGEDRFDWWLRRFKHEGSEMKSLVRWGPTVIYLVTPKASPGE